MFLKSLRISNLYDEIRFIRFHAGLNLIVDETPVSANKETGNNVGKTTVLMLIDFCLGASPKSIYTDPESKKNEYQLVKNFLVDTEVLVTLTLGERVDSSPDGDLVIERNFLPRRNLVRRINGKQLSEPEFEEALTNQLFPGHYGKKPTFPQIISHNIRYKDLSVTQTLKTLSGFTRDDEYETLYLFLLGCDFDDGDEKQNLLQKLRIETSFKSRLEATQTRSAYESLLSLLMDKIKELDTKRATFKLNTTLDADLNSLQETKYSISVVGSELARAKLRRSLVSEAAAEIGTSKADVDMQELRALYDDVDGRLSGLTKTFDELVQFHNRMINERARYISKELPELETKIRDKESELAALIAIEAKVAAKIIESGSMEDLEKLVTELNDHHRRRGEYETIIGQITQVDANIELIKARLAEIDGLLFSSDYEAKIQGQLGKLNRHFAAISEELYGEQYALKADRATTRNGQQVYKFTSFNTNLSSGKKQGEITCFDIAYTLFADDEGIPCYHFLLNDKKELMHDNQLTKIGSLVERQKQHVQFVASILRDKLPPELNNDRFIVVKLSQHDKLFRIEQSEDS